MRHVQKHIKQRGDKKFLEIFKIIQNKGLTIHDATISAESQK